MLGLKNVVAPHNSKNNFLLYNKLFYTFFIINIKMFQKCLLWLLFVKFKKNQLLRITKLNYINIYIFIINLLSKIVIRDMCNINVVIDHRFMDGGRTKKLNKYVILIYIFLKKIFVYLNIILK
jgi:hypothetical protein